MRARSLLLAALLAAGCQPIGTSSPPGGPGGPSPSPSSASCGQTLSANFLLGADLACPGDALVVAADGITVDLGGHALTGPGRGQRNWPNPNLDSVGVKIQGRRSVTVRNGTISSFSTGVLADRASGILVEEVDSRLSYYGVYFNDTTGSTVRRSLITRNTYGLHLQRSNDNQILDNQLIRQEYSSPGGYGLYLFASRRNKIVGNSIGSNLNWGLWFSDSRENVVYHNNVAGNSPQVSDNVGENTWYEEFKKEGNYWADYGGIDRDGDGVGDSPYQIGGPGTQVDPYPFMQPDGWTKKRSETVDHYAPPAAKARADVRLVALAGGGVLTAAPSDPRAASGGLPASSIAIAPDRRTLYALSGSILRVMDALSGALSPTSYPVDLTGVVAANRDGRHAIVLGPEGALSLDVTNAERRQLRYAHEPRDVAPSWKHNILFVSTEWGIDVFYIGRDGHVPYTLPLDGPGGPLAMNASGTRLYAAAPGSGVIDVVDTEQYAIVDRLPIPWEPVALAVAPDESALYVAAREGVRAIDLATKGLRGSAFFYGTPVDVGVSPNGDQLYVALDGLERGIAVVSTTDLRLENFVLVDGPVTRLLVASY